MKEEDYPLDVVQLDEIRAFLSQLLRPQKITPARCQSAATTGDIEPIEAAYSQLLMKERIRLFLKAAIGACDHQRMRAVRRPFRVQDARHEANIRCELPALPRASAKSVTEQSGSQRGR